MPSNKVVENSRKNIVPLKISAIRLQILKKKIMEIYVSH